MPEKLASASLILTIITWGCCASVICLWWTGRLIYAQLVSLGDQIGGSPEGKNPGPKS